MKKFLDLEGVKTLWKKIKAQFVSKSELSQMIIEDDELSGIFQRLQREIVLDTVTTTLIDKLPNIVPYTLHFVETPFETKDLNTFVAGNSIYNVYGIYANSPRKEQIQGSIFNFGIEKEYVYHNRANVHCIYQFLILIDGEIYNRVKYNNEWTEWKQIQREYPK